MTTFDSITPLLEQQAIELPSWAFGNSGTRFKVFSQAGVPRTPEEKIADAAQVHRVTGLAPTVALHIPWDRVDDYAALARFAEDQGVALGTINSNTFQDDDYKLGSVTHSDPRIRQKAIDHHFECIDVMNETGSRDLKIWLADGTNYPGQDDIRARQDRLADSLAKIYERIGDDQRLVLEYKFFEPAFYHTDLPDWGTAYAMSLKCGPQAQVLVDTGHHPHGTNIPQIVSFLLSEGRLGGFHFNSRKYADDDLIVGTENPFELFDIFTQIVQAGPAAGEIAFMLDQSHNIEAKVEAVLQSIVNCQTAYAKALSVDYAALEAAQRAGDVLAAHRVLMDAYQTDVRPLLRAAREAGGLPADPIKQHRCSGYAANAVRERGTAAAGGGYPDGG
jgi:L-rhamnose isomerase/sugar isomerase